MRVRCQHPAWLGDYQHPLESQLKPTQGVCWLVFWVSVLKETVKGHKRRFPNLGGIEPLLQQGHRELKEYKTLTLKFGLT